MRWSMKTERGVVQLAAGELSVDKIATKLKISPGFARPLSPALGTVPTPVAAVLPVLLVAGATIPMTANGRACRKASNPMSTRTVGTIELVRRIRGPNFRLPDAARRGRLHSEATQGHPAIAALAGGRRGANHGCGRERPFTSCAGRDVARDEPWPGEGSSDRKETHWGKRKLKRAE
jgi:hypothetical protein